MVHSLDASTTDYRKVKSKDSASGVYFIDDTNTGEEGSEGGHGEEKEERQSRSSSSSSREEEEEEEEERALLIRVTRGAGEPPSKRSSTG